LRQLALKTSLTFYQLKKEKIKLSLPYPPHAIFCHCSSYLKNKPTLNGGERGGVWIILFPEVTAFADNVSTIFVANWV